MATIYNFCARLSIGIMGAAAANNSGKGVLYMQYLWAFLVGGAICLAGQILLDWTKLTPARILVGFVVLGVILSAVGLYEPLVEFAGAGATVPLTGFGHLLAKGVRDGVDEAGALGIFTGGLKSAAGGVTSAVTFGLAAALVARPKSRSKGD